MTAYYNEIDLKAAAWLRELIKQGHIAPGEVDDRDIRDIRAADLHGFAQCHFFAGIGVWSRALRRAGWPDERPVWTGSCPCQPFSAAGKGGGFDDERHLWPAWFWLIEQCRPAIVFGEQVASKGAEPWIDLVQDDLEAMGYGVGAVPFPAAGVGAPHIRDRTYWVANANDARPQGRIERGDGADGADGGRQEAHGLAGARSEVRGLGFSGSGGPSPGREAAAPDRHGRSIVAASGGHPAGPTNGLWRDADWLLCRDGKWRPVEPGTFPLVDGAPARVGRLRGYGNGLVGPAAVAWISSYLESSRDLEAGAGAGL